MKNNIRLLPILLALLLLCSCTAAPAVPATDVSGEVPESTTDIAGQEPASPGWEAADDFIFPICENEYFRLELLLYQSLSGANTCLLRAIPLTEDNTSVDCSDIVLNGSFVVGDTNMYLTEGEPDTHTINYALLGKPLQSFRCTVDALCYDTDYRLSQDFTVSIPLGFQPHPVCLPLLDAKATRQTVFEDERIKLSLIAAGDLLSSNYSPEFSIVMLAENKTDAPIPFVVSGAAVNGIMIDLSASDIFIPAKQQLFTLFNIDSFKLGEAGITSISDLSLQILTEESENTGMAFKASGGSWYPVVLQQSGTAEDAEIREILYEDDTLQISLFGISSTDYSFDDHTSHKWHLSILNKTDQNLTVSSIQETLNGVPAEDNVLGLYDDLGANTTLRTFVWVQTATGEPVPEISFCLKVASQGSGSLLYTVDTPIVLPTE